MKITKITARVQGDNLLYWVCSFSGHIVRVAPNGKISRASDEDKRAAKYEEKWHRDHAPKHQ